MGFDIDGEFLDERPVYEPALIVQHIGGRGRCTWDPPAPLPLPLAKLQLTYLRDVVARLETEISAAEEEAA